MNRQLMKRSAFVLALLMLAAMPFAQAQVAVGDILCEGGQIYTPATYPSSGATAIGVVFYVDGTGQHGWAVALRDPYSNTTYWGLLSTDTPLGNYSDKRQAIYDLDGYQNTQVVLQTYTNSNQLFAWNRIDFENGWYMPSIGQLNYLYGNLVEVNASLALVGGVPFKMNGIWQYWSSTEASASSAWCLYSTGELNFCGKTSNSSVRGAINF